jgi:hypothetical protein
MLGNPASSFFQHGFSQDNTRVLDNICLRSLRITDKFNNPFFSKSTKSILYGEAAQHDDIDEL